MGVSPSERIEDKKPGNLTSFREIVESEKKESDNNYLPLNSEKSADLDQSSVAAQPKEDGYSPVNTTTESR